MSEFILFNLIKINFYQLIPVDYFSLLLLLVSFLYFQISIIKNRMSRSILIRFYLTIANSVLFLSVVGLILQPELKLNWDDDSERITIITKSTEDGFSSETVEKVKYNRDNTFIFSDVLESPLDNEVFINSSSNVIFLPGELLIRASTINKPLIENVTLEILGDGFTQRQVQSLTDFPENYFSEVIYVTPVNRLSGLVNPIWNRRINLGEYFNFNAKLYISPVLEGSLMLGSKPKTYIVRLINPVNQLVEEKKISASKIFQFRIQPKISGLLSYRIELHDSVKMISEETIVVEVTKIVNSKILILQSSPSFETKQLQNWAGDQGAKLVVNTKLNEDISFTRLTNIDIENQKPYKENEITKDILDGFDLLVIDARRFNELDKKHQDIIGLSIKDGLGLIILSDESLLDSKLPYSATKNGSGFIEKLSGGKQSQIYFAYDASDNGASTKNRVISELPVSHIADTISYQSRFEENTDSHNILKPIIVNANGHALVSQIELGLGKVSYSLIQDTFRWVSNGEKIAHSQYWQYLIKMNARTQNKGIHWLDKRLGKSKFGALAIGSKIQLCVTSAFHDIKSWKSEVYAFSEDEKTSILFNRNPILNNIYCAYYWPKSSGWHKLEMKKSNNEINYLNFYINDNNSWKAENQRQKIESTLNFQKKVNDPANHIIKVDRPFFRIIDSWIWWFMIIISLSFIWVERKYSSA